MWGQEVHAFADSNDAGRDGAFHGAWRNSPGTPGDGTRVGLPFVLQCKYSKVAGKTLTPSDLEGEFTKIPSLVEQKLCQSYVLLTNCSVTAISEERILSRLREAGVQKPHVSYGQWICSTIAMNRALRMFVPRVYGLGDLSQILDERAYEQASALLDRSRDVVSTFVITPPYRKAAVG